jgi:hypothetical protein
MAEEDPQQLVKEFKEWLARTKKWQDSLGSHSEAIAKTLRTYVNVLKFNEWNVEESTASQILATRGKYMLIARVKPNFHLEGYICLTEKDDAVIDMLNTLKEIKSADCSFSRRIKDRWHVFQFDYRADNIKDFQEIVSLINPDL